MSLLKLKKTLNWRSAGLLLAAALVAVSSGCKSEKESAKKSAAFIPPWPEWTLGHWVWKAGAGQSEILQLVDDYLAREIPVSAVVVDKTWQSGINTFEWDSAAWPDPETAINELHAKGVRILLWATPVIRAVCQDGTTACREAELYQQGLENHYFMGDGDLIPLLAWNGCPQGVDACAALIDYFNPDAVSWWHSLMDPVLELGIDGWKCDTIEPFSILVSVSPYAGPTEPWEFNDAYYRDFFYYTREKSGDDKLIMARAVEMTVVDLSAIIGEPVVLELAFPHAPREVNFAGWAGEQNPDFDGLKSALTNIFLSAEVGYLFPGSDIGGAKPGNPDQELFIRWTQLAALSPLMVNGGEGEHRPWMIGGDTAQRQETLAIYKTYVDLHYALLPYLDSYARGAWTRKLSTLEVIRTGQELWEAEYLLFQDVLVAPIYESGGTRTVRFPEGGNWVYLWDRTQVFQGGTEAALNFPLAEYPVFLRQGSAVEKDESLPR